MTPQSAAFFARAHRRIADLSPDMQAAILRSFRQVRDSLSDRELTRLIESGQLDKLLDDALLDRSFLPVRSAIRQTVEQSYQLGIRDLPKAGKIDGVVGVAFNTLSPDVIRAVKALDDRVLETLKTDIRETVRQAVENGLSEGRGAASVAREIRSVIGMPPHAEAYVRNLRAELESGKYADAARRQLLDRRFNLAKLDALSAAEKSKRIDTIVEAYRKSTIANNAKTVAGAATSDAYKSAQQLSWKDAQANGIIPAGFVLMKRWYHTPQPFPRLEHLALDGTIVPFDQPYPNGDTYPGEQDPWGCKCNEKTFLARAA